MPDLTCPICSEEFYRKPSRVRKYNTLYCSRQCAGKGQRNGEIVNCYECGEEVYRSKQYLRKNERFFCSRDCAAKWRKDKFKRENHGNWKHGKFAYENIMKEKDDAIICVLCGEKDREVLVIHHIDEDRTNNNPDNLIWLCYNCHHLVHNYSDPKEKLKNKLHAKKEM